jgi:glycosyltransferase involved in cell wall biosynthesis
MLERQTLKDFEVIIVDDGSTDGTAEALATSRTRFDLRYIRLEPNRGAGAARNIGLDDARGRYVALLDSDDSWHPDKLRRHVQQFEAAEDRDRLVGLSRQIVLSRRTFESTTPLMDRDDRVGKYLFQGGGVIQSSTMFLASDLARAARFAEGEVGHDDWTFALKLEALGARFEMLPDALVYYRDDERPGRRSPRKALITLDWLERYRGLLGDEAYFAARAAFGSRMPGELGSLGMIATGFSRGVVSPWRSAYYFATWAFPSVRRLGIHTKQIWLSCRSMWRHKELA